MSKNNSYHIDLDGQGYMLKGTPTNPQRVMEKAPVFGNRFASGDRDYTDFSIWWYWAQTDWSNGIKEEKEWKDDLHFWYSSSVDAFSKVGSFQMATGETSENNFTPSINVGNYLNFAGTTYLYIGTGDNVYRKSGTWSDITTAWSPASYSVTDVIGHKEKLWITSKNTTSHQIVECDGDGANQTDHTTAIETAMGYASLDGASCMYEDGNTIYFGVYDSTGEEYGIAFSDDAGATFTKLVSFNGDVNTSSGKDFIMSMIKISDKLYYIMNQSYGWEVRYYDLTNSADFSLNKFYETGSASIQISRTSRRFLHDFNGKLIITLFGTIWEYDYTNDILTRLFKSLSEKPTNRRGAPSTGAIIHDNKLYWQDLVYDGAYFFNNKRADDDSITWFPLLSDGSKIYFRDATDDSILWYDSAYKSSADTSFLVFNEMQEVSTIRKLAVSVTILFEKFDVGESISVYYTTEAGVRTLLGTASYAVDGASAIQKTFLFGNNVDFRKIQFEVVLNGDGSSTPIFKDISLQYLPIPEYKHQWSLSILANDYFRLLDLKTREKRRGIDVRHDIRNSFLANNIVDFQDIDYSETKLNGSLTSSATTITVDSTDMFPEKGRLKIEDEEVLYTGKTATTFTGCTRGYRGTNKIAHNDNTVVSTKYKVLILEYSEELPVLNDDTAKDFIIKLKLIEA